MDLVVDANVLLSALIKEGLTRKLMLNSQVTLYAPEFLLDEFYKHIGTVSRKAGIPAGKLRPLAREFFDEADITVFATPELEGFMGRARALSPDPDDAVYFALALKLGYPDIPLRPFDCLQNGLPIRPYSVPLFF